MPRIERYDMDGDPIFAVPDSDDGPAWDLDGSPAEMGMRALCAVVARDILGCRPEWWGYYCDWCCTCEGNPHGIDSQCSAIAGPAQLHDQVVEACDRRGIALLAAPSDDVLRAALVAWRGTH